MAVKHLGKRYPFSQNEVIVKYSCMHIYNCTESWTHLHHGYGFELTLHTMQRVMKFAGKTCKPNHQNTK